MLIQPDLFPSALDSMHLNHCLMVTADMLTKNTHHHYCCFHLDYSVFFYLHVSTLTIASH